MFGNENYDAGSRFVEVRKLRRFFARFELLRSRKYADGKINYPRLLCSTSHAAAFTNVSYFRVEPFEKYRRKAEETHQRIQTDL